MRSAKIILLPTAVLWTMLLAPLWACTAGDGDDGTSSQSDSICGEPGDQGNEQGVGKYCLEIEACAGQAASICAIIGNPQAHFCTRTCVAEAGAEACGTGASCQCQNGLCGCMPDACL